MTDDLADYRAELAAMDRGQAEAEVERRRGLLQRVEDSTKARGDSWTGLSTLHARLRLAERRLLALGGANGAGKFKRRSGHARSK